MARLGIRPRPYGILILWYIFCWVFGMGKLKIVRAALVKNPPLRASELKVDAAVQHILVCQTGCSKSMEPVFSTENIKPRGYIINTFIVTHKFQVNMQARVCWLRCWLWTRKFCWSWSWKSPTELDINKRKITRIRRNTIVITRIVTARFPNSGNETHHSEIIINRERRTYIGVNSDLCPDG